MWEPAAKKKAVRRKSPRIQRAGQTTVDAQMKANLDKALMEARIRELEAAVGILIRGAALGERLNLVQQRTLLNLLNRIEGV